MLLAVIKDEDRLKPTAELILSRIDGGKIKGVYASTASMQEIIFWLYNRQLLKELTAAVNVLSHLRNIEWVPLTTELCLTASLLINEYKISPFNAYQAAIAISKDKTILSTDHVYDKIRGVTRLAPTDFAKTL